jgi:hypothetical protein
MGGEKDHLSAIPVLYRMSHLDLPVPRLWPACAGLTDLRAATGAWPLLSRPTSSANTNVPGRWPGQHL